MRLLRLNHIKNIPIQNGCARLLDLGKTLKSISRSIWFISLFLLNTYDMPGTGQGAGNPARDKKAERTALLQRKRVLYDTPREDPLETGEVSQEG